MMVRYRNKNICLVIITFFCHTNHGTSKITHSFWGFFLWKLSDISDNLKMSLKSCDTAFHIAEPGVSMTFLIQCHTELGQMYWDKNVVVSSRNFRHWLHQKLSKWQLALLALCEGNPWGLVDFPYQRASSVELLCLFVGSLQVLLNSWIVLFLCYHHDQAVEQTVRSLCFFVVSLWYHWTNIQVASYVTSVSMG